MNVHPKLAPEQQLTIAEFLAMVATRPDGERWELIEGVAVFSPSPVQIHQMAAMNILSLCRSKCRRSSCIAGAASGSAKGSPGSGLRPNCR